LSQTTHSDALVVAERISGEVGKLKLLTGSEPLTLSMGITESGPGDAGVKMIARAEQALFQAKAEGRNCRRVVLLPRADAGGSPDAKVSAVA